MTCDLWPVFCTCRHDCVTGHIANKTAVFATVFTTCTNFKHLCTKAGGTRQLWRLLFGGYSQNFENAAICNTIVVMPNLRAPWFRTCADVIQPCCRRWLPLRLSKRVPAYSIKKGLGTNGISRRKGMSIIKSSQRTLRRMYTTCHWTLTP